MGETRHPEGELRVEDVGTADYRFALVSEEIGCIGVIDSHANADRLALAWNCHEALWAEVRRAQTSEAALRAICHRLLSLVGECTSCGGTGEERPGDACARCGGVGELLNATGEIAALRAAVREAGG